MPDTYSTALGASRLLLRIVRALNLLMAVLLVVFLVASFFFEPTFREFLSKRPPHIDPALLMPVLRFWMLLGLPALAAVHVLLTGLLAIVETVRDGDPFVPENAARLTTIAWCLLAVQLFDLACGALSATMNAAGSNMHWSFSVSGWIAVALLFVLARVFELGTRIRGDLQAMI